MTRFCKSSCLLAATVMCGLGMLASGCGSFSPRPDMTRYYTLSAPGAGDRFGAVPAAGTPVIGVRVSSLAAHLRRPGIAVRTSGHELRYAQDHLWADRLDSAVERAVAAAVQRRVGSRITVIVSPPLRSPAPDVLVDLDVLALEGRAGAEAAALVVADWRIVGRADNTPVASGRFAAEKPGWSGADYAQLASLLAAAVDDLAGSLSEPAARIAGERVVSSISPR